MASRPGDKPSALVIIHLDHPVRASERLYWLDLSKTEEQLKRILSIEPVGHGDEFIKIGTGFVRQSGIYRIFVPVLMEEVYKRPYRLVQAGEVSGSVPFRFPVKKVLHDLRDIVEVAQAEVGLQYVSR